MKHRYTLLSALFVFCAHITFAQMVGDNVFLQGRYVEIGIAPNGGYGSTLSAPAGYHPYLGGCSFTFWDPAAGSATPSTNLIGFVADYGADGWTVGTPPYFGDFYLPGDPQEGWAIKVNGVEGDAYIPAYLGTSVTGFTGGLSGTNVGYSNSGGIIKGVWQGNDGALSIRQTTTLDTTKLYFTINVVLTNTGAVPLNNIYYIRTVDPDNEETRTGGGVCDAGNFATINTITYQLPDPGNRVLVSTTGITYTNAYLGLGTKDCRAKAVIFNGGGLTPGFGPDSIYNEHGLSTYLYAQGATNTADVGVGLVFQVGTIAAGDSTSLSYAYILNASYIDSALNSTQPSFSVNGTTAVGDTDSLNLCTYGPISIAVDITNGGFYNWTWAPDSFLSSPTGIVNTIHNDSITSDITYTITGTNAAGGCDSVTFTLRLIHDTFPGPAVTPVTYCQGDAAAPLTPSGPGYTWWPVSVGGAGSGTAPAPSTTTAGTFLYYVSQSVALCQSLRSPDTVVIKPLPPPPYIAGVTTYCIDQTFVPFTVLGTNVLWYTTYTGGVGDPTAPTVNTLISGTDTFFASQTVNGCEGPRAAIAVTVLNSILPSFADTVHYGCHGDTVVFANQSAGALRYIWNFGDGYSDTATNPVHVYLTQGVFSVELEAINQACVLVDSQSITLIHRLQAAFTDSPFIYCQDSLVGLVNLSDSLSDGPLSFVWLFGDGTLDSVDFNVNHIYKNSGVYNVQLVATNFIPCHDTASLKLYIDSTSALSLSVTDSVICRSTYITFVGNYTSIGNTGVTWDFGDGDSIVNINPVAHAYDVSGTYTVTVTPHFRACRDTSVSKSFTIYLPPALNLGADTSICPGSDAITLVDSINRYPAHWLWSTGETTQGIIISAPGSYWLKVTLNGCSTTDSILVRNDCYMDIPNAFTPNGDGMNDYFFPRQYLTKGLIEFSMNIYNRWGQLIFQTTSLDGSGWDGKFNGVSQPEGVYVYIIDAQFKDGQKEHHQGNVTLLR